jgi:hypothetical protein
MFVAGPHLVEVLDDARQARKEALRNAGEDPSVAVVLGLVGQRTEGLDDGNQQRAEADGPERRGHGPDEGVAHALRAAAGLLRGHPLPSHASKVKGWKNKRNGNSLGEWIVMIKALNILRGNVAGAIVTYPCPDRTSNRHVDTSLFQNCISIVGQGAEKRNENTDRRRQTSTMAASASYFGLRYDGPEGPAG